MITSIIIILFCFWGLAKSIYLYFKKEPNTDQKSFYLSLILNILLYFYIKF